MGHGTPNDTHRYQPEGRHPASQLAQRAVANRSRGLGSECVWWVVKTPEDFARLSERLDRFRVQHPVWNKVLTLAIAVAFIGLLLILVKILGFGG